MSSKITYDFHTHILPSIDDGAKNIENSIDLLSQLNNLGVINVALTSHFYTNEISLEDFIVKRNQAFGTIKNQIPKSMNIKLGAEVFITDYLFNQEITNDICLEGTNYVLCEFSYDSNFKGRFERYIDNFFNRGMIPIIAHIERYPNLMKDKDLREELLYKGAVFQSNYSSFLNSKYKRKLIKMLKDSEISIFGSDVHSNHRNPVSDLVKAQEYIEKKLGVEIFEEIEKKSLRIFS